MMRLGWFEVAEIRRRRRRGTALSRLGVAASLTLLAIALVGLFGGAR